MALPATKRFPYNPDLENNQLLRTRLENVNGAPTTHPAEGRVAYNSATAGAGGKRGLICVDSGGSGTWARIPRLELEESVSGLWTFTRSGTPFAVNSTTRVDNLNVQFLHGFVPSIALAVSTVAVRSATGTLTVQDAVLDTEAVNLRQLSAAVTGRKDKAPVRAATVATLPSYTYSSNVLTAAANGAFPEVDGVTLEEDDSLLVKDEMGANAKYNGIWTLTTVGNGSTPWQLTRRDDADDSVEVDVGLTTFVEEGEDNINSIFTLIEASDDPVVLNTTLLTFGKTGGNTLYKAGNGLALSGDTFHFATAGGYTTGDLFGAGSGSTISRITAVAAGNVLLSAGTVTLPTWGKVSLSSGGGQHVTGVLPAANGGTGQSSYATGDILYADTTSSLARLAKGSDGRFLKLVSGFPSWQTLSLSDLGGVNGSGTTNRLSKFTGSAAIGDSNLSDNGSVVTALVNFSASALVSITGGAAGHLVFTNQSLTEASVAIGSMGWTGTVLQFKPNATFTGGNAGYNLKRVALAFAVELTTANATAGLHSALGTDMTITHNLGTSDVIVSVRELTNNAEEVEGVNWRPASANTIQVYWITAPASGQYRVVIIG